MASLLPPRCRLTPAAPRPPPLTVGEDAFGKRLLEAGISEDTIKAWAVDPRVALPGGASGSLFDALEDLDLDECVAKAVAINAAA